MKKNYLTTYKLFFGLLGFSAIITEIATTVERGTFNAANFFSYFTIESNIIAVIVLLTSALYTYAGKKSVWLDYFRGAATFYMVVTGIVFAFLLSGITGVELTAVPWDNTVLHYLIPVAIAIDWMMNPPVRRFSYRQALAWLIFPILYLIYSLSRGAIVGWYPYPFINPANGGYEQVLITSMGILVGGLVLIFFTSRISKRTK
ncbi:MAG: FAR7a/AIG1-like family protein [Candidatus Saccharibacteria bacterium]|nr:FAR7a/AIG1-like family protein [Candidatus Saccharibacteria bacterium]